MIKVFTDFPALLREKVGRVVEGKTATGDPIFASNPHFLYEFSASMRQPAIDVYILHESHFSSILYGVETIHLSVS